MVKAGNPKKRTTPRSKAGADKKVAHKSRPGTAAKRLERKLNKDMGFAAQRAPFVRLVRGAARGLGYNDLRFSAKALLALQAGAESWGIGVFEDSALLALNANRTTVMGKDVELAVRMCK